MRRLLHRRCTIRRKGVDAIVIYPAAYVWPFLGGAFNPYFGGFGHFNKPLAGAGFSWPGFTFPFNLWSPGLFAARAGFLG